VRESSFFWVLAAEFMAARRGKDDYGRAREMEKSRARNDFWLKTLSTFISIFSVPPPCPSAGIMLAFVSYGNWELTRIMTVKARAPEAQTQVPSPFGSENTKE
jgi:hypothetical protein